MGTRHLVCVADGGEYKVAQYGQFDGYPDGVGLHILRFVRWEDNLKQLKEGLKYLRWATEEDYQRVKKECGLDDTGWMNMDQAEVFGKHFPELARETSSEILEMIVENAMRQRPKQIAIQDSIDFAGDSLFCEWAYVIDFDKGTLEVYKGFNQDPEAYRGQRFENAPLNEWKSHSGNNYYPIVLAKTYFLDTLPSDDEFLNDFIDEEEE
jgi:hypothetical protein